MVQITNTSQHSVDFVTGVNDGQLVIASVRPGETTEVDVADDNPTLVGHVAAGAVRLGGEAAAGARGRRKPTADPVS